MLDRRHAHLLVCVLFSLDPFGKQVTGTSAESQKLEIRGWKKIQSKKSDFRKKIEKSRLTFFAQFRTKRAGPVS